MTAPAHPDRTAPGEAGAAGLVLFAHGSRLEAANDAVRAVAARLAQAGPHAVEAAFLEGGKPGLAGAVDLLADRGVSRIVVIPYFLTPGTHIERDLPQLVERSAQAHPGLAIQVTPPLDGHPALLEAVLDRAAAALADGPS